MYISPPDLNSATTSSSSSRLYEISHPIQDGDLYPYANGGDSQLQRWSSLIGIITAIVGNILISFALNIQRYAHIRLHKEKVLRREKSKAAVSDSTNGYGATGTNGNGRGDPDITEDDPLTRSFQSSSSQSTACSHEDHEQVSTYLQSPYWWGGIILMTVGEAGNFLAYGFAPASIVSPLGVVALISNCVIAPIMLKERFRLRDFWGVVVAVGGAVTVVLSAKTEERKLGPHEIIGAITRIEFEIYMAVTIVLIGILMWASPRYGSRTILVDLGLVGLFGGYTALSTKGVASMLSATLWRAFSTPVTYALIAVLGGTAVMQVKYVNKALQRFDSTQVIPVQFVMFTLSVIIGSAILYRDFEKATVENVVKFVGGCLLTFFGVWLITSGRHRDEEDEGDGSDEERDETVDVADQEPSNNTTRQSGTQKRETMRRESQGMNFNGGDATYDKENIDSRRSSHVSFAEPFARPRTPRTPSNTSGKPELRVTSIRSDEDLPSHSENTPLLTNPWKNNDLLQASSHPGMASTSSSPLLPSEAQLSSTDSLKPPMSSRAASQEQFHTHPSQQHGPTPPPADRPKTPSRHSISRMLPGPLLSPLSGGLSVVVADSLRRGVDSPSRSKSLRHQRLGLQRSRSGSQRMSYGGDVGDVGDDEYGTSPLKQSTTAEEISRSISDGRGLDEGSRVTRARSLSNTLGDLFRGKKQRIDRSNEQNEEVGPSGS